MLFVGDTPYTCQKPTAADSIVTGCPSDRFREALQSRALNSAHMPETRAAYVLKFPEFLGVLAELHRSREREDLDMIGDIFKVLKRDFDKYVCITWT